LTCNYVLHINDSRYNMCLIFNSRWLQVIKSSKVHVSQTNMLWGLSLQIPSLVYHLKSMCRYEGSYMFRLEYGPSYHYFMISRDDSLFKLTWLKIYSLYHNIIKIHNNDLWDWQYFVEYCQSHKTLLRIWIMLWRGLIST